MIAPDQIRAARALKNWSQAELAERAGVATPSIANIELGKQKPSAQMLERIVDAFILGGVLFTRTGVEKMDQQEKVVSISSKADDDRNIYLNVLEDAFYTLVNNDRFEKEILIFCGDDRVSPKEVNDIYRKMRKHGITTRQLAEEGNTYLVFPLDEYRYMPREFFINQVTVVYGEKSAILIGSSIQTPPPNSLTIFNDPHIAQFHRNIFNLLWSYLPCPTHTTAIERIIAE